MRTQPIEIPVTYLLKFENIDVDSWSWGHVMHMEACPSTKMIPAAIKSIGAGEGNLFVVHGPAAGNIKYFGHHGLFEMAFAAVAAGLLPADAFIATVIDGRGDTESISGTLLDNGAVEAAYDGISMSKLASLNVDVAPPQVRFSKNVVLPQFGRDRLAGGLASRFVAGARKTFLYRNGRPKVISEEKREADVFNALTLGRLDAELGGLSDEPVDGFGANHLAMADWSECPLLEGSFLARKEGLNSAGCDIGRLWSRYCEQNSDVLFSGCFDTPEGLAELSERLGISSVIDAYLNGLTIEDLIA